MVGRSNKDSKRPAWLSKELLIKLRLTNKIYEIGVGSSDAEVQGHCLGM